MVDKRSWKIEVDRDGQTLRLNDYRGAPNDELRSLIHQRGGELAEVYLDREAFLNLLELQREGICFSLRKANLNGIDLSSRLGSRKIQGHEVVAFTVVKELDLSGAILKGADLTGVLFDRCNLRRASLRNTILTNATFAGCQISGAIFLGAKDLQAKQIYSSAGRTEAAYDDPSRIIDGLVRIRSNNAQKRKAEANTKPFAEKLRTLSEHVFGRDSRTQPRRYINILDIRSEFESVKRIRTSIKSLYDRTIPSASELPLSPAETLRHAKTLYTPIMPAANTKQEAPPQTETFVKKLGKGRSASESARQAQEQFAKRGLELRHQRRLREIRSQRSKEPEIV